jgi:hypothetical protein
MTTLWVMHVFCQARYGRVYSRPVLTRAARTSSTELGRSSLARYFALPLLLAAGVVGFAASETAAQGNLLFNPTFEFHAFVNHRDGERENYSSHNAAFWNTDAWGDIAVTRESHVADDVRPAFSTHNLARIAPGKRLWQFLTLPEMGLAHGDHLSLHVFGSQLQANALRACIDLMKLDSEDGTWSPADFGMGDKRTFPRQSRGELVVATRYEAVSDGLGSIELTIEDAEIVGRFRQENASHSDDANTIGVRVSLENTSPDADVWVFWPSLCRGSSAMSRLAPAHQPYPYYRHIPRTIQKLWKGESIHIVVMGSSIDRASANPPMYFYDEDPASPMFKQPLAEGAFDPALAERPDLEGYVGQWRHYFAYGGRLRLELMRKFNVPVSNICLNFMACDGSCVGEAHSGLSEYLSLSLEPGEEANGHKAGGTWRDLYPGLFARPEGPRPDLVIFGSGANEKTDKPDEVAVFEGMVRWIQRHYPHTEFLFCQFQNVGGYTPNVGDLQALALRYQIPFLDYGKAGDDITRWCNQYALVPSDGHPQAAAHYLWFKQMERAFECWDPILPGQTQLQLPERVHPNTYGWEGEMVTYAADNPRIKGNMFVFDDTAVNCWGSVEEGTPVPYVDGEELSCRRSFPGRNIRNSLFRHGRCRLGDRHVLDIAGPDAKLTCVDAKVCPNRRFLGVDNPQWELNEAEVSDFTSEWGAPYGSRQVMLEPGSSITLDAVFTDVSVAYVDMVNGGTLRVTIDGEERLAQATNIPFVAMDQTQYLMENRKGVLGLAYGLHTVRLEAVDAPVTVLGVFSYDSRSNRAFERRVAGQAAPGETVTFSQAFKARPVVLCSGGIRVDTKDTTPSQVTFSGEGMGFYEVVGE